jgi:hypothetical protein
LLLAVEKKSGAPDQRRTIPLRCMLRRVRGTGLTIVIASGAIQFFFRTVDCFVGLRPPRNDGCRLTHT